MIRHASFAILAAATMLAGCGSEGGASSPAPRPAGADAAADAAPDSSASDAQAVAPDAGVAVRRTVSWRDPFGDYAATDNLLMDGDFEWAGPFTMQYPWFRDLPVGGISAPAFAVGTACRSGIRCANVSGQSGIAGFAMRPPANADHADLSLWIKPPASATCAIASVSVAGCVLSDSPGPAIDANGVTPDSDGWCHLAATVPMPNDTPCVFISVSGLALTSVLVDDVVMTAPAPQRAASLALVKAGAEHARVVDRLRAVLRERLRPAPLREPPIPQMLRGRIR